ncbi:MAG: hypothetical protein LUE29_07765 [Lachnospiraceae bacterium]|nr:hypothetical protein [Lachnospiraceae bacterium]
MGERKGRIIQILCIILSVAMIGVIVYMVYVDRQSSQAQTDSLASLIEEAKPYEAEVQELQSELTSLKSSVSYTSEEARLMVGFAVTDVSDLSYIEEKADAYGLFPVIVLDCTLDTETIEEILEEMDASWEIMLYATDFSEETNASVLSVMSLLESSKREYVDVFFLRGDYSSDANIQLLIDDGFVGYTSYNSDTPQAGQTEDGFVYFDYSWLTSSGTSVASRVSAFYKNKASMIVTFDMESINSGKLTETYVVSTLDGLLEYTENDDCFFATAADVVAELSMINEYLAEQQEENEARAAEIEDRISELQQIIRGIYDKME